MIVLKRVITGIGYRTYLIGIIFIFSRKIL
jgi:hypothetical protein